MKKQGGYLTVYLCLCLSLLIPLYLALIEGARQNGAKLEAACATEAGLQSTLAEYNRALAERFNLYAIDASYGTATSTVTNTEAHLFRYLEENLDTGGVLLSGLLYRDFFGLQAYDAEVYGAELLTDHGGSVFRSLAVDAVKEDFGYGLFQQVCGWLQTVELNGLDEGEADSDRDYCMNQMQQIYGGISEQDAVLIQETLSSVEQVAGQGILKLVTDEAVQSTKVLYDDTLAGCRVKNGLVSTGNMGCKENGLAEELLNKFLFREYLVRYFSSYTKPVEGTVLDYELEYLLVGKNNDVANLKSVAHRLLLLREASNLAFLTSDETKQEELHTVATALSALLWSPELEPVIEGILVCIWSYSESVYDVKALLKGGKIPLQKTNDTWHYGLSQVIDGLLSPEEELPDQGLGYGDYLRIFLMLTGTDKITYRAMNLVEGDIRLTERNENFRLDGCYSRIAVAVKLEDARGKQYELLRTGGYE